MPELNFKGKEFVYNHHLTVPHRPLVPDADKSVGAARLDGNLIVQGDNLHPLKSLLPMYANKVDCIFIDAPYNTGNEGWCYNDNVNSPMMWAWLETNPVGIEDGLRQDKWCEHLAGNDDTAYEQSVLQLMTEALSVEKVPRVEELEFVVEDGTRIACDLVLMTEWKTRLPTFSAQTAPLNS